MENSHCLHSGKRKRAIIAVQVLVLMTAILGFAALTVDVGAMYNTRADLQRTADATSLAAAHAYFAAQQNDDSIAVAIQQAQNIAAGNAVFGMQGAFAINPSEIQFGEFTVSTNSFIAGFNPPNAVRVIARRSDEDNGALDLFFARIFGEQSVSIQAEAVTLLGDAATVPDGVPIALRTPGFGPVDPKVAQANPGKDGPSSPEDGIAFQIGEQVTLFIFGKGKQSPVHLVLDMDGVFPGTNIGDVLSGDAPGVPLSVGDELPVIGEGTGQGGLGNALADRLDDGNLANDTIIVPIVEEIVGWHGTFTGEITDDQRTRNDLGEIDGSIRIVDFAAIHIDGIIEATVPDPNDPQENGKTIDIELLVGTVVQLSTGGGVGQGSGVVAGVSAGVIQLVR